MNTESYTQITHHIKISTSITAKYHVICALLRRTPSIAVMTKWMKQRSAKLYIFLSRLLENFIHKLCSYYTTMYSLTLYSCHCATYTTANSKLSTAQKARRKTPGPISPTLVMSRLTERTDQRLLTSVSAK